MRTRLLSCAFLLALGNAFGCDTRAMITSDAGPSDAPSMADAGPPPIAWGACPERFRDSCATIMVPLDHAQPSGEQIEIFLSHRQGTGRQLWLLQGGPGASAESFFNFYNFLDTVDPDLDIYTIEHRGVGSSTRLGCSAEAAGTPGEFEITASEWPLCEEEVRAEWGDGLAYFTTTQAAHDLALAIDRTRRPGQETVIYGISYGSIWANRYAVLHPDQSAGVILDGSVQPGATLENYDTWFEPVGREVFTNLCTGTRCAEELAPDPQAFFERTYTALEGGHCRGLGVDIDTWRVVFAVFLMDHNLRDWLPALIRRLDRCSTADQRAIADLFGNIFGRGGGGLPRTSRVTQVHVLLSENWPRTHVDSALVDEARMNARFFQDALVGPYLLQDSWPRYAVDPNALSYPPARVPMLVMTGRYDPAAPPARVATGYRDNLRGPHQTYAEMPYGAHGVLTGSPVGGGRPGCPAQLVNAFLADPTATLPVSCVADVIAPTFDATPEVAMRFWGTPDLYN